MQLDAVQNRIICNYHEHMRKHFTISIAAFLSERFQSINQLSHLADLHNALQSTIPVINIGGNLPDAATFIQGKCGSDKTGTENTCIVLRDNLIVPFCKFVYNSILAKSFPHTQLTPTGTRYGARARPLLFWGV